MTARRSRAVSVARFRLNLPQIEELADTLTADAPNVAKMRVRKFCGQWVVAGRGRHHACGSWGEAFAVALFVFVNGHLPVEEESEDCPFIEA